MKTIPQIHAEWQDSRADLHRREARWRERRQRFNRRAVITIAILYALTFRAQAFGGTFAAILWLPTLAVGALATWPVVHWRLGPLLAAPVFMSIAMGWELLALVGGFFTSQAGVAGDMLNPGPALVMVCTWGFWAMTGTILGVLAAQEDDDTIQV